MKSSLIATLALCMTSLSAQSPGRISLPYFDLRASLRQLRSLCRFDGVQRLVATYTRRISN